MTSSVIRTLGPADLDDADALLCVAFASPVSVRPRLARYHAIQPDGWFGAFAGERLVGMVGALRYGAFGYIGFMAVHPAAQRAGHGRRLLGHVLDWLAPAAAILDATEEGEPLYATFGFVDAGRSHELTGRGGGAGGTGGSLEQVVALDRALFGADRRAMWTRLLDEDPARLLVTDTGGGGYLYVQDDLLGPFGARSPEAARALVAAAPARTFRVQVPGENAVARATLADLGFTEARAPKHLRRGDPARWPDWSRIWGKGSFCLG